MSAFDLAVLVEIEFVQALLCLFDVQMASQNDSDLAVLDA